MADAYISFMQKGEGCLEAVSGGTELAIAQGVPNKDALAVVNGPNVAHFA